MLPTLQRLAFLCLLGLWALNAQAQDTASLTLMVLDADGEPAVMAAVFITQSGTIVAQGETDFEGNICFGLTEGEYSVRITYAGQGLEPDPINLTEAHHEFTWQFEEFDLVMHCIDCGCGYERGGFNSSYGELNGIITSWRLIVYGRW